MFSLIAETLQWAVAEGVLKEVCLKLIEKQGLVEEFNLPLMALRSTFQQIQSSYQSNPYHNAAHAADVAQAACCLVAEEKVSSIRLSFGLQVVLNELVADCATYDKSGALGHDNGGCVS